VTTSLRRSALYLPASNARAIAKARTLACDVVILDLEDAVAPEEKVAARLAAVAAAGEGGFGDRLLVARVNGHDTPWGADDLRAVATAGFDAVLVPKVSSADDIRRYAAALGCRAQLWAMIETCASVFALDTIAATARDTPLSGLVMGTNDLAKEMRVRPDAARTPFLPFLSFAVAAARAAGLIALDGVFNELDDPDCLAAACAQSVAFGFDGRTLIHPAQIAACNAAFTPTAAELAQAHAIIDAFGAPANANKGAVRVNSAMVERLHLAQARRTVATAETCAAHDAR